ncbi:FecCD family ABC transporter permease [Carboxylicivirga sp. N1Y90]|uniref:FecCD family ABC transporter permease n=1 Tax=Carboxylicivirga fragile TaxID=3417571 RepID=UPI003D3588B5|nr:iron ABC transporter permease [Marinilabiliaceae bacterium N1Y90]
MISAAKYKWIVIATLVALVLLSCIALLLGPTNLDFAALYDSLSGDSANSQSNGIWQVITQIRLPRVVMAILAGTALSASGSAFQSIFRNPMSDPYVLGISSGASVGATIAIVLGIQGGLLGIPIFAFLGACSALIVVYWLAFSLKQSEQNTLLLAGIAMSLMLGAIVSLLLVIHRDQMESIIFWTLGGFNAISWQQIWIVTPVVIFSLIMLFKYAKDLNLLAMGNETAHSLGINVKKKVAVILLISALSVSIVVAYSGVIGFVGLIVPHMVRFTVGADNRKLLPLAALWGGIFLIIADTLARTVVQPGELPVGSITALFGAPYFFFILIKRSKSHV